MNIVVTKGGAGSGDFGHAGRPGLVGGSGPGGGSYHDRMVADWQDRHLGLAVYQQEVGNRGIYVYEDEHQKIKLRMYANGVGVTSATSYDSLHDAYQVGVDFLNPVKITIKRPDEPDVSALTAHESKLLMGLNGGAEAGNVFYAQFGTELDDFLENAFVQDLGNGINSSINISGSTVYKKNGVPYMLHIDGEIRDSDTNKIGNFSRNLNLTTKSVENTHFELNPSEQGKGVGMDFYRTSEQAYVDAGFKDIKLFADMSVGGYAWARMGFDFDRKRYKGSDAILNNSDYEGVMRVLKDRWYHNYKTILPKKYSSMKHSWEIATIVGPDDHKIGKDVMRGSSWSGVKILNAKSAGYKVGQLYYAAHDRSRP